MQNMKKKFLWMFMVAAVAMTSCSSFDEPAVMEGESATLSRAGSRAFPVDSEETLKDALDFGEEEISITGNIALSENLVLDYPVTILGGSNGSLSYSGETTIVCNSDVVLNGLTITANNNTGVGAVTLNAKGITLTLDGVNLTQNAVGTEDARSKAGIAIKYEAYENNLIIRNSNIIMPSNKYVRGIDMLPSETTKVNGIEIYNSSLSIGTTPDFPSTYSRGISFSNIECNNLVVDNSTLEGAYYIININGTSKVNAKVVNGSTLSGRCGFNVWSNDFTALVEESTIVGKNNWSGPTEVFADIVINTTAQNSDITLRNMTFKMDVNNQYQSNEQYAIQYRASNQKLTLEGNITVIDTKDNNVQLYVKSNYGVNNVDIIEGQAYKFIDTDAKAKIFYQP